MMGRNADGTTSTTENEVSMRNFARRLLLAIVPATAVVADEVIIQSIDYPGTIVFSEVSNAIGYRIEWSSDAGGDWTNFAGDLGQWMDHIPISGIGTITAAVPMAYRIVAVLPPPGMVYIPHGSFMMGNATNVFLSNEGETNELPQHDVYTDAYFIDKNEVSIDLWNGVKGPAVAFWGYSFSNQISPYASSRPMTEITWYDAVKWCNARSEGEGLVPVYYTDPNFTNVYKTGEVDPFPDWHANGYRLPTEAEWEKAARGGVANLRFPWSDYANNISHDKANYSALLESYDQSAGGGSHPVYGGLTAPVGSFAPNDYGIYDMAGNIMEWCWDWYDAGYYSVSPMNNPRGVSSGTRKTARGGSHVLAAMYARCSFRDGAFPGGEFDYLSYYSFGFRCVRKF